MLPEVRTVIEKGNMTDAEYIAALIAENLATRSDMKKLDCQPKIVQKLFSQRESLKLNRS